MDHGTFMGNVKSCLIFIDNFSYQLAIPWGTKPSMETFLVQKVAKSFWNFRPSHWAKSRHSLLLLADLTNAEGMPPQKSHI
jgi:hypothetical protein